MDDQRYERCRSLTATLWNERSTWETHWRDLADFHLPHRIRLTTTDRNKGDKRNAKIIDNSATIALRTMTAGLSSGITSPARPWFKLGTPDPSLMEFGPVKRWLFEVNKRMAALFLRSNLYNVLPTSYRDLGLFGTSAFAILEDERDLMRCYAFSPGSYALAVNARNVVDTFVRKSPMTVQQIVERFGDKNAGPNTRWAPFSDRVKNAYQQGQMQTIVDVWHVVNPNEQHDPKKLDSKFKRYASVYYEAGGDRKFLSEKGFDTFPIICPRWDVTDEDVYGRSPAMDALGDVKALQVLQKRKAQAVEKMVNPPLNAPTAMRQQKVTLLPGDVNYADIREGQQGIKPVHEVRFEIAPILEDIRDHRERIDRAFYVDLFLMVAQMDRSGVTATEIAERKEEKLLALGPTLERLNDEKLDPTIERAYVLMEAAGMIPPPPPELNEVPLRVEYVSVMAQAQKVIGAAGVERFAGFVGNIAQADPEVVDVVNRDVLVRDYGDITSINPNILRDQDEVDAIRAQRAQAQAAEQQANNLAQVAKGAQLLSQVDTSRVAPLADVLSQG